MWNDLNTRGKLIKWVSLHLLFYRRLVVMEFRGCRFPRQFYRTHGQYCGVAVECWLK